MSVRMSPFVEYLLVMHGCYSALPENERQELQKWEKENINSCTVGTADWPGWVKYIGPKPILPPRVKAIKKSIPLALRISVYRRDNFRCVFCGSEENLTVDHKIPESKGGLTTLENLQTACRPCNIKKGSRL